MWYIIRHDRKKDIDEIIDQEYHHSDACYSLYEYDQTEPFEIAYFTTTQEPKAHLLEDWNND